MRAGYARAGRRAFQQMNRVYKGPEVGCMVEGSQSPEYLEDSEDDEDKGPLHMGKHGEDFGFHLKRDMREEHHDLVFSK